MASDPLSALLASIDDAKDLPSPTDYQPTDHPLNALKAQISQSEHAHQTETQEAPTGLASEVMQILERTALSGASRRRAIDAAYRAKQNPTTENIQAVLDILVGG